MRIRRKSNGSCCDTEHRSNIFLFYAVFQTQFFQTVQNTPHLFSFLLIKFYTSKKDKSIKAKKVQKSTNNIFTTLKFYSII